MDRYEPQAGLVKQIVRHFEGISFKEAEDIIKRASKFEEIDVKNKQLLDLVRELEKKIAHLEEKVNVYEKPPGSPLPPPLKSPKATTTPGQAPPPPPPPPAFSQDQNLNKFRQAPVLPNEVTFELPWKRILLSDSLRAEKGNTVWELIEQEKEKDQDKRMRGKLPLVEKVGQVFEKPVSSKMKDMQIPKSPSKYSMVDSKREKEVLVFRAKNKAKNIDEAIFNILTTFDLRQENQDIIEQVYKHKPTEAELAAIKGGPQPCHVVDEYLLFLSQIPNFEDRVWCYLFVAQTLGRPLDTSQLRMCHTFLDRLSKDSKLRTILHIVLENGNYLNGRSKVRERADGFELDVLARLNRLVGCNGKSFLTYIVNIYQHFYSKSDELPTQDPMYFQRFKGMDLEQIGESINQMEKNVKECETRASRLADSDDEFKDPFNSILHKLLADLKESLLIFRQEFRSLKNKYTAVVKFYHVNAYTKVDGKEILLPMVDFFGPLEVFHRDFKETWKRECSNPYTSFDKYWLCPPGNDATDSEYAEFDKYMDSYPAYHQD